MKSYIKKYRTKSIETADWKNHFESMVKSIFNQAKADSIIKQVDWDTWINKPGFPPVKNNFSNKWTTAANQRANDLFNNKLDKSFLQEFTAWSTNVKLVFLNNLIEQEGKFTENNYVFLRDTLGLYKGFNDEVKNLWYKLSLITKHSDGLEYIEAFLGKTGRMKYIRPLYKAFGQLDRPRALAVFEKYRNIYHPIAVDQIEKDFAKAARSDDFLAELTAIYY